MMERLHTFRIVGAYAAAEHERKAAVIAVKDAPVELLTTASYRGALGVEDKGIDTSS